MEIALKLTSNFHGSPDYWLSMSLVELHRWLLIAHRLFEEEKQKRNVQRVGPGL